MLEALITSKTRIKLLTKFFLNPESSAYLRGLSEEFGESSNAIRVELNRFEEAGLLESEVSGNKKMFKANRKHPLYPDINQMLQKTFGIDLIIKKVIEEIGDVEKAYLTGEFAMGKNSHTIDILLIGSHINTNYLIQLIKKVEILIKKKIRYIIINEKESAYYLNNIKNKMLVWSR